MATTGRIVGAASQSEASAPLKSAKLRANLCVDENPET
jgi:hypothetical protein